MAFLRGSGGMYGVRIFPELKENDLQFLLDETFLEVWNEKKTLTTGRCFYYLLISGCEKLHLQNMVLLNRSHLCE